MKNTSLGISLTGFVIYYSVINSIGPKPSSCLERWNIRIKEKKNLDERWADAYLKYIILQEIFWKKN